MADNRGLGCFGALLAVPVLVVIAWKTLELTATIGGAFAAGRHVSLISDAGFLHQLGELTILAVLLVGIYLAVFRSRVALAALGKLRGLLWAGAALEFAAWIHVPEGVRWRTWALVLAVVGLLGPWLISRLARKSD